MPFRLVSLAFLVLPFLFVGAVVADEPPSPTRTTATEVDATREPTTRLRIVVTTDFPPIGAVKEGDVANELKSDPDDLQSIVRFLLYANEFDIEGLIVTSGTFANRADKRNLLDVLDRYAMVEANLRRHDPRYPTAEALRQVTFQGRDGTWGRPGTENIGEGQDSEASDALIAIVDRPDPRPVYVSASCRWKPRYSN